MVGTGLVIYSFTYAPGAMPSSPVLLSFTAANQTKPYGTTFTFAGTEFTVTGLQGTDSVTSVTLTSAGAPATAAVGPYPIIPSAAVGTGLANYTITYVPGAFPVTAEPLTIRSTH